MTRLDCCNSCPHNVNDVCLECKLIHPDKDCLISVGVTMTDAHCPLGLWQQQWTIVICNPSRQVIRASYELSQAVVVGDPPPWYIGKTLLSPPRYHAKYSDQLRWLQKAIDESTITENFLWVDNELPLLSFQELRVPRYTTDPINPINEALLWEGAINYETLWPMVFNKGRLQEVLDTTRGPFHAGTIYYNRYPTNNRLATSPPRESLPYCPLEGY